MLSLAAANTARAAGSSSFGRVAGSVIIFGVSWARFVKGLIGFGKGVLECFHGMMRAVCLRPTKHKPRSMSCLFMVKTKLAF